MKGGVTTDRFHGGAGIAVGVLRDPERCSTTNDLFKQPKIHFNRSSANVESSAAKDGVSGIHDHGDYITFGHAVDEVLQVVKGNVPGGFTGVIVLRPNFKLCASFEAVD